MKLLSFLAKHADLSKLVDLNGTTLLKEILNKINKTNNK